MAANFSSKDSQNDSLYRQLMPMSVAMSEFKGFLQSPLGEELIASEQQQLLKIMPQLIGYNCLQLSVLKAVSLCDTDSIGHYIKMGFAPNVETDAQDNIWADYQSFPIAHDCIDIAVLHHVLEFANDPAQLLREADRTLTAGGHLLIMGFNPISAWSIYQYYLMYSMRAANTVASPHSQRVFNTIRQGRLADWLSVLNYDVLTEQRYFFRPPVNSKGWLERLNIIERWGQKFRLPFGLVYFTLARKRSSPVNPLRSDWRRRFISKPASVIHSKSSHKKNS